MYSGGWWIRHLIKRKTQSVVIAKMAVHCFKTIEVPSIVPVVPGYILFLLTNNKFYRYFVWLNNMLC